MNCWIRFEDTYGMADRFCAISSIQHANCGGRIFIPEKNLYFEHALGDGEVLKFTENHFRLCEKQDIDLVVLVYDMDNDYALNKVYDSVKFEERVNRIKMTKERLDSKVQVVYMPVVYSAESIVLYQYTENIRNTVNIVNRYDTKRFQLEILKALNPKCKIIKRTGEYLNVDKLLERLRLSEDLCNQKLITWFINRCAMEARYFLSTHDAIEHCQFVEKYFQEQLEELNGNNQVKVRDVLINKNDSIEEVKQKLKVLY